MTSVIFNASSRPLNQNTGTTPECSDALLDWLQPMTFTLVAKIVNNVFQVQETPTPYSFNGVWQNAQPTELEIMEQGERRWNWYTCHAMQGVPLKPDDVITYLGVQYRVMSASDWMLYGFVKLRLIQDFSGSGP